MTTAKPFAGLRTYAAAPIAIAGISALALTGCGGSSDSTSDTTSESSSGASTKLALVAYSTPQVVYDEAIPAFEKTPEGKGVKVTGSFGASGDQSRAVEGGQEADVVTFSIDPDVNRLVKAGLVEKDWKSGKYKGLVSTSVATFVVRKGNPKKIKDWSDLIKPGIKVITPNPFSSGAAKWNLLAGYAANGGIEDPKKGLAYLRTLITKNVESQPASGRDASQAFTSGKADVLISYENEALTLQEKGAEVDYVTPADTIKIEIPLVATKSTKSPEKAKAFVDYLQSDAGQEFFAKHGYRPGNPDVLAKYKSKFPEPSGKLTTIDELGGWSKVNDELFDVDKGTVAKIEEDAGVSTEK